MFKINKGRTGGTAKGPLGLRVKQPLYNGRQFAGLQKSKTGLAKSFQNTAKLTLAQLQKLSKLNCQSYLSP